MPEPVLALDNIETCYGLSQVLFGVSLAIAPNEMVTLMGRNGMGKTTTVRSIMGLTAARSGAIRFMSQDIRGLPSYKVARHGLVPRDDNFPDLSVRENLLATAVKRNGKDWTLGKVMTCSRAWRNVMAAWATSFRGRTTDVGYRPRADDKSDSPHPRRGDGRFGAIDPCRDLALPCQTKNSGLSILVIDKNVGALLRVADRHFLIKRGRVVWKGLSRSSPRRQMCSTGIWAFDYSAGCSGGPRRRRR